MTLTTIAVIHNGFPTKFGIPRQSGLAEALTSRIVFEPEYRSIDAVRGLEGFSHLWLIWGFSANRKRSWTPTVRPPRLGGNKRMGVFATRSPVRPNPIGLSPVRLERIETDGEEGPVLHVLGADLMDGTPIYDIKPYLPYVDAHPEALCGYVEDLAERTLEVRMSEDTAKVLDAQTKTELLQVLHQDPRPAYQEDPTRVYGFVFRGYEVRFTVRDGVLTVCEIQTAG